VTRLAVIIVNYKAGQLLLDCLAALYAQLAADSEVYLVDNASNDPILARVESQYPSIALIQNPVNVGFARANNQVLASTDADYYLLLNPDVELQPGAITIALEHLDSHPDIGILGARVLRHNGLLDPAARRSFKGAETYFYKWFGLSKLFGTSRRFGRYYLSYLDESKLTDVDSVVGAFMIIRSQVLRDIGFFDERFFIYCEDEDFCYRAKLAGFRVVYHPAVVARHRKGHSTSQVPFRMLYHWHRSLVLYHVKNIGPRYRGIVNWIVYSGITVGFLIAITAVAVSKALRLASELSHVEQSQFADEAKQ
jgi:GT2 family glycosyltransferase